MADFDDLELRGWVAEIAGRHPVVGLAVGVVHDGGFTFVGNGVADLAAKTPITEDTAFRIASITKTFTAIALMQLWEQGAVNLDAPAHRYLRAYRLVPAQAGHRPATLRHLLTHTAGLPEVARPWGAWLPDFGESVEAGRPVPSLAEYYRGALRQYAETGTRFVYGNHSPATVGQVVQDVAGEPLASYFRRHIFEPLGMEDTDLIRSPRVESRLAAGYEIRSGGVKEIRLRDMVTVGAASIYSTPRDMARYLAALLGGGSNEHGSVLKPETLAMMFEPHHQPDPRIPGLGLAFFREDLGGHPVVGHQGTLPGFHSQILVAPRDGVGVMAFTNGAHQADFWLPAELSGLLRRLVGVPGAEIVRGVPHHPEIWGDICGWYALSARASDVRLRTLMGAGVEIFLRGGQPMLRFLTPIPTMYRGFHLLPLDETDPYVFGIDLFGTGTDVMRLVFGQGAAGATTRLHFDRMPITLDKRPAVRNPRLWAIRILGATGAVAATSMVVRRRGGSSDSG